MLYVVGVNLKDAHKRVRYENVALQEGGLVPIRLIGLAASGR